MRAPKQLVVNLLIPHCDGTAKTLEKEPRDLQEMLRGMRMGPIFNGKPDNHLAGGQIRRRETLVVETAKNQWSSLSGNKRDSFEVSELKREG